MPKSAIKYVSNLEKFIDDLGFGKIATIAGRYYAMDRDHNWDRTDLAFNVLTKGSKATKKKYKSASEAVKKSYEAGITDEYIEPALIEVQPGEEGTISSNDAVIFVNFRNDRPRQLVERFIEKGPSNIHYTTMTQYNPNYQVKVAYSQRFLTNTLGEILSNNEIKQLRIAETEKFAHLTFFFNCKREEAFEFEDRVMLDSYSDIKTHDERPEMRTPDTVKLIIQDMQHQNHQMIMTNIPNLDMVGHSGKIDKTIEAVEIVDKAIKRLVDAAKKYNYDLILTADHGNAEELYDEKADCPVTCHTTNPVPLILLSGEVKELNLNKGSIADIAPTILKLFDLPIPNEMTGKSLF